LECSVERAFNRGPNPRCFCPDWGGSGPRPECAARTVRLSQAAEKLAFANVLYQGTASVMPESCHYDMGFIPWDFLIFQG
jgi:hypothetical protein